MSITLLKNNTIEAFVKIVDSGNQTITLASLAHLGVTPIGMTIEHIDWSVEDGEVIHVRRGPAEALVDIFNLSGNGEMDFKKHHFSLEEFSNTNIACVGKTGSKDYNIIFGLSKILP